MLKRGENMPDFYVVNFKEVVFAAEDASIYLEMEIEKAKAMKAKGFKIIHGYGSHGAGGKISINLRQHAFKLRKENKIKDIFTGAEWAIQNKKCFKFLEGCKFASLDEDLGRQNPGITIIVL